MSEEKRKPGRPPGSKNKRSDVLREMVEALPNWKHPLQFLVECYTDDQLPIDFRMRAAIASLPYLEAQQKAIEVGGMDDQPVQIVFGWEDDDEDETESQEEQE